MEYYTSLIILILILNNSHLDAKNEDKLLEAVEHWIRYSIHEGYINKHEFADEYTPPNAKLAPLKNSAQEDFDRGKSFLEQLFYPNWMPKMAPTMTTLSKTVIAIEKCQKLIADDFGGPKIPKWKKTLMKISDLIGWTHFTTFAKVFEEAYGRYQTISPQIYKTTEELMGPMNDCCEKAGINLPMLQLNMQSLGEDGTWQHDPLKLALAYGQLASGPLLHIVLYRSLLNALTKNGAQMNKLIPLKYHGGMPRRDYVIYWLHRLVAKLTEQYHDSSVKFVNSMGDVDSNSSGKTEKEEYSPVELVFIEWAKYIAFWDTVLNTVEYGSGGLGALDNTIDLFGPKICPKVGEAMPGTST